MMVVASDTMLVGIVAEEEGRDAELHKVEADTLLGLLEEMEPEAYVAFGSLVQGKTSSGSQCLHMVQAAQEGSGLRDDEADMVESSNELLQVYTLSSGPT